MHAQLRLMCFFLSVPEAAPLVTVEDMTSPHSFAVSWTPLPEEHVMGRLLGYRVIFKAVKAADERVHNKEATLTVDGPEVLRVELTGLKSYTSYVVQVAGFTSKGDGPLSAEVTGGNGKLIAYLKTVTAHFSGESRFSSFGQTPGKVPNERFRSKLTKYLGKTFVKN